MALDGKRMVLLLAFIERDWEALRMQPLASTLLSIMLAPLLNIMYWLLVRPNLVLHKHWHRMVKTLLRIGGGEGIILMLTALWEVVIDIFGYWEHSDKVISAEDLCKITNDHSDGAGHFRVPYEKMIKRMIIWISCCKCDLCSYLYQKQLPPPRKRETAPQAKQSSCTRKKDVCNIRMLDFVWHQSSGCNFTPQNRLGSSDFPYVLTLFYWAWRCLDPPSWLLVISQIFSLHKQT